MKKLDIQQICYLELLGFAQIWEYKITLIKIKSSRKKYLGRFYQRIKAYNIEIHYFFILYHQTNLTERIKGAFRKILIMRNNIILL